MSETAATIQRMKKEVQDVKSDLAVNKNKLSVATISVLAAHVKTMEGFIDKAEEHYADMVMRNEL